MIMLNEAVIGIEETDVWCNPENNTVWTVKCESCEKKFKIVSKYFYEELED